MIILKFLQFSAPYKGAFINSLERLEELNNINMQFVYVFPNKTKATPWIHEFMLNHKVYFTSDNLIKSTNEILNIFTEVQPDIAHTHFDGYDMPVIWARNKYLKRERRHIKIIWHLRNRITFHSNLLKKLYQYIIFKYHYGYLALNVNVISVSQEMEHFVNRFKKRNNSKFITEVVANGVKVPKNYVINERDKSSYPIFGAFGSRNEQKRVDVLLKAGEILAKKNVKFKILITKGVDTQEVITQYFKSKQPDWLILIDQTDKIYEFFSRINCFVSTSIHETFSNAILEATFYNTPVIQSDIAGTQWNAYNPSTFVFESVNAQDLSAKMEAYLKVSKEEIKQKCIETKEINKKKYDVDIWCKKISDIYINLTN
jgi:glycosyltransferase involved in cell wall biosynthesis